MENTVKTYRNSNVRVDVVLHEAKLGSTLAKLALNRSFCSASGSPTSFAFRNAVENARRENSLS